MRVNKGVGDACLVQDQMQVLDVVARRAEHDRLLPGRNDFLEQVEKRGNLALLPAVEERHSKRLRDLGVDIEPDERGVGEARLGEFDEQLGQRRREERGLPRVRKPPQDLAQLFPEPHLEEAVGLVEHDVLHRVQFQPHLHAEMNKSAGRRDDLLVDWVKKVWNGGGSEALFGGRVRLLRRSRNRI